MGQAPADPAAQVLILNLARRDHDGFCRVEHRQSSNGRCLLRPVVSWDAKGECWTVAAWPERCWRWSEASPVLRTCEGVGLCLIETCLVASHERCKGLRTQALM